VASGAPFHAITEAETKPLPDAAMVRAALPVLAELGLTPLREGRGFGGVEEPPCDPPLPPHPTPRKRSRHRRETNSQRAVEVTLTPGCNSQG
jgi:hypothetical protein